ncbi:hypothetical protein B4096_2433 [Heyndrickxia coagulans]|nr:hypothetical protein B4100_2531 [Heyndrickxia coagulans]KYC71952.1 hypothetical protein B4096_2433 [Heyndrickxia coagulans]
MLPLLSDGVHQRDSFSQELILFFIRKAYTQKRPTRNRLDVFQYGA